MRVALASQDWPGFVGGGVATLARVLARGLRDLGHDVEVWTRGGGGRRPAPEPGVSVVALPGRAWRARGRRHWARGAARRGAEFAPDCVIATTWDPMPGLLDALQGPLRCFAFGRDVTGDLGESRRERERSQVWADSRVSWITLTEWMRVELGRRGVPPAAIRTVHPAVDEPAATPRERGPVQRLLTVGRLVPRKGQDRTIEALRILGDPMLRYEIVGAGPDRARLEALIAASGLSGQVVLLGRLVGADLERAFDRADVFVMPARVEGGGDTEGYGLVYLEAAARGLPSVGGRSAGAAEAVEHEVTGLLVDAPDDPEDVAAALRRLIDDPARARALGRAGRSRFEERGRPRRFAEAVLA